MSKLAAFYSMFLLATTAACGASQAEIGTRVDVASLAPVAPGDRDAVADAYASHWDAERELEHWQFELADVQYALDEARAQKSRSEIDRKLASLRVKRNKAAFLGKAIEEAQAAVNGSKRDVRASDLKIRWLSKRRDYLEQEVAAAQARVQATDAAFELAKAKLAQAKGIAPKGFKMDAFVQQAQRRAATHRSKRQVADRSKAAAIQRHRDWQSASK